MRKPFLFLPVLFCLSATAQNVGIGETVPTARLEVKASSITNSPLLIKTNANEELFTIAPIASRYYTNIGGQSFGTLGIVNISNQFHTGVGSPLLRLAAFQNFPTAGSISSLEFGNSNNIDYGYRFDAQLSSTAAHRFSLLYKTTSGGLSLMTFNQNGALGIGANPNVGKVDVYHNSTTTDPHLSLTETETDYARLSFRNTAFPNFWSMTGLTGSSPINDRFNFYHSVAGEIMSITGDGKVGIGLTNPGAPLEVKTTAGFTARFGGNNGMYISLNENNLYRGYLGSYSGNAEDVDFGTGLGNTSGRVHLTIEAVPKLTVEANGSVNLTNELTRTNKTGSANLLPVAYGSIAADGTIRSGTGNFTVTKYTTGGYAITVTGETFSIDDYIAQATPYGPVDRRIQISTVFTHPGALVVFVRNAAGGSTDGEFAFTLHKP